MNRLEILDLCRKMLADDRFVVECLDIELKERSRLISPERAEEMGEKLFEDTIKRLGGAAPVAEVMYVFLRFFVGFLDEYIEARSAS